jgi:hypothetical protein
LIEVLANAAIRKAMSRAIWSRLLADNRLAGTAAEPPPSDGAQIAEDIGLAALDLAELARSAGFTTIGCLLESVALGCGAQAVAAKWPIDERKM